MPTVVKLFSPLEAAEHNSREDCWIIVDGMVYDVTEYLDDHPGGDDIIVAVAGKDATEEFEDAGHSKTARELMKGFCVGEVDPTQVAPPPTAAAVVAAPSLQLWAAAAVAVAGVALLASLVYSRRK